MQRDPSQTAKAREREQKAMGLAGMISIKLDEGATKKGGFKKGGFRSAFGPANDAPKKTIDMGDLMQSSPIPAVDESDTEDEGYEKYDPAHPTD